MGLIIANCKVKNANCREGSLSRVLFGRRKKSGRGSPIREPIMNREYPSKISPNPSFSKRGNPPFVKGGKEGFILGAT
jgi:hypothetical protein